MFEGNKPVQKAYRPFSILLELPGACPIPLAKRSCSVQTQSYWSLKSLGLAISTLICAYNEAIADMLRTRGSNGKNVCWSQYKERCHRTNMQTPYIPTTLVMPPWLESSSRLLQ
jgi:hypothetical protein